MQQSPTQQALGLSIRMAYTSRRSKIWETKLEKCFSEFSISTGRLRHGIGNNRELISSVRRINRNTTTVHFTDPCPPVTLVAEHVIITSTKSAKRFQLGGFQPNFIKSSEHHPRRSTFEPEKILFFLILKDRIG